MKKLVPFLIRQKVYIDTANIYASYLRYPTMVAILLGVFHVHVTAWMVMIGVPALIITFRMFGWAMLKVGAFQEEASRHSYLNPYNVEVLDRLKNLENALKVKESPLKWIAYRIVYSNVHVPFAVSPTEYIGCRKFTTKEEAQEVCNRLNKLR